MFLDVIIVIIIIYIVVIHFLYIRYQSLLLSINILKRSHEPYNRSYAYIYMHIQFEIFRSIGK